MSFSNEANCFVGTFACREAAILKENLPKKLAEMHYCSIQTQVDVVVSRSDVQKIMK